ncbi:MAG: cytochrome c4 [Chromatiales bacterium]|nr:cytochrome c4 [Chromatiales bacterium]
MNKKSIVKNLLIVSSLTISGAAFAVTPSASMLGNTCAGCHGTNGSSNGPATPNLAGISSEYFIDAMAEYKEDSRPATIMSRIAKGYTDEEIQLLATFFSEKKVVSIDQSANAKKARSGKKIHKKYCEKCHEDGGRSSEDDAGILASQMMPYLRNTIDDFISGDRDMPKKMRKRIKSLQKQKGDKGIDQLIHYYGSQR